MNADIDWLQRRWALPPEAIPAVRALIESEKRGGTAVALNDPAMAWGKAALDSGTDGVSPLVLVRTNDGVFLQSRVMHDTERGLAGWFRNKAREDAAPVSSAEADPSPLFPGTSGDHPQLEACRIALRKKLALITGGPGAGKTYTLARILALLLRAGVHQGAIRLAAPTGKAAQRMGAAVTASLASLPETMAGFRAALADIAAACGTLHSLLGCNPATGRLYNPDLPAGTVLVVDECTMVDIHLWRAVLAAIPPDGRLILLGDPNQLESVGQGNVFAEISRNPPPGIRVHLTGSRRFEDRPAILELAEAIEHCEAERALKLLATSRNPESHNGVVWIETAGAPPACRDFPPPILCALEAVARAADPAAALAALERVCILTAQREYFVGAKAVGEAVHEHLATGGMLRNEPVLIGRNDPETGLHNGSVGVIHRLDNGSRRAFFPGTAGEMIDFHPGRLPEFSPAWAITIHRSQGSEYDEVLVIAPRGDSPLATRELLYTAITRARRSVYVAGDAAAIGGAIATRTSRCSMLGWFLTGG